MTEPKVTAAELLLAVRKKHHGEAVVRELVIDDREEIRIRNRSHWEYYSKTHPAWVTRLEASPGWEMADEIPEGWNARQNSTQRRIDALIIGNKHGRSAIEIKVSRADFRRETEAKRRSWLEVTNRFIYVAPTGVIPLEELPAGCGLWEYDRAMAHPRGVGLWASGLTVTKRPKVNKDPKPLPEQIQIALAYRTSRQEWKDEAAKASGRRS